MTPKFCEISTLHLFYVVPGKSKVEIMQNFVAVSEYMNFKRMSYEEFKKSLHLQISPIDFDGINN